MMSDYEWHSIPVKEKKGISLTDNKEGRNHKSNPNTIRSATKNHSFGGKSWSKPISSFTCTSNQLNLRNPINPNGGKITTTQDDPTKCNIDNESQQNVSDFHSKTKKSLSDLLQDYGEYDPDFDKVRISAPVIVQPNTCTVRDREHNSHMVEEKQNTGMLLPRGKAPIHVKIVSFGFKYNVPLQSKEGWSHSNPLPVFDCRDLPRAPQYVAKLSGMSYQVKRALLHVCESMNSSSLPSEIINDGMESDFMVNTNDTSGKSETTKVNTLRERSREIGRNVVSAVAEAIRDGGYGYVAPMEMTFYIGSEYGRHRSIVLSELVAQVVRTTLRRNNDGEVTQPVSVEAFHRDVDKHHKDDEAFGFDLRKDYEMDRRRKKNEDQDWLQTNGW